MNYSSMIYQAKGTFTGVNAVSSKVRADEHKLPMEGKAPAVHPFKSQSFRATSELSL